ncbi:MAG TPA: Dabb family protein, partial [Bryobacteraceae bacterium]|nr:Dabb family protein [Bryobacteraceae bacterium]
FLTLMIFAGAAVFAAEKPRSVIHVVTLRWKEGATKEQIDGALKALENAASKYPGITRLWLRPISVQGAPIGKCEECRPVTHAFVMEFESEDALKNYRNSAAQKAFYEVYIPLREESRTHDISN